MFRKTIYHFTEEDIRSIFNQIPIMDKWGYVSFGEFSIEDENIDAIIRPKIAKILAKQYSIDGEFTLRFIPTGILSGLGTHCDIELETIGEI